MSIRRIVSTPGAGAPTGSAGSTLASLGVHGALLACAVGGGLTDTPMPDEHSAWTKVVYLAPPPQPSGTAREERLTYVGLAAAGITDGAAAAAPTDDPLAGDRAPRPTEVERTAAIEEPGPLAEEGIADEGEIYLESEVENPAAYDPASAAPAYPEELRAQSVPGRVLVEFVVDTSGLADVSSFVVHESSHPAFLRSVRTALPGMRFAPASVGERRVRQRVLIPFVFQITLPTLDVARDSVG